MRAGREGGDVGVCWRCRAVDLKTLLVVPPPHPPLHIWCLVSVHTV